MLHAARRRPPLSGLPSPRELSTLLLSLALLSPPGPVIAAGSGEAPASAAPLCRLAGAALARVPDLPLYDAAVVALSLQLLAPHADLPGSSGGNSASAGRSGGSGPGGAGPDMGTGNSGGLGAAAWAVLSQRLSSASLADMDEAASLAVLRVAMAAANDAAAAMPFEREQPSVRIGSSGGGGGGGKAVGGYGTAAAGVMGSAGVRVGEAGVGLPGPRPARGEVAALLGGAPAAVRQRVLEAYQVGAQTRAVAHVAWHCTACSAARRVNAKVAAMLCASQLGPRV
jgi:hypothetical protein